MGENWDMSPREGCQVRTRSERAFSFHARLHSVRGSLMIEVAQEKEKDAGIHRKVKSKTGARLAS